MADASSSEAGAAPELVDRIQKLREKAGLEPTDLVEVFFESLEQDLSVVQQVFNPQEYCYIRDAIGSPILPSKMMPAHAVVLCEENFKGISNTSYKISLATPALFFQSEAILALYGGNTKFARRLQTYLLSRDRSALKSEFQLGQGKIKVKCIENQPAVEVILGEHVFCTAGDYYLSLKNGC